MVSEGAYQGHQSGQRCSPRTIKRAASRLQPVLCWSPTSSWPDGGGLSKSAAVYQYRMVQFRLSTEYESAWREKWQGPKATEVYCKR